MSSSVISWYDANADRLATIYEGVPPTPVRAWLDDLLPAPPALVVDVGAGTGRDAGAFAAAGYDVVAVEPSPGMRAEAERRHPSSRIRWLSDSLPGLAATSRLGLGADVVSLSAVWQHVAPPDRPRAFRRLVGLLRSGGLLALTLRHGPDDGRGGHPVSLAEVEALARDHGLQVLRAVGTADRQGRPDVSWTSVVLRLPDDGTGALPLLRHLILADAKSATYKLGLLRALCRAADGAAGLAEEDGDDYVRLPLGLVALNWLRLYLPLAAADLPQAPGNRRGAEGLGFAGPGWQALAAGAASQRALRVGAVFGGDAGSTGDAERAAGSLAMSQSGLRAADLHRTPRRHRSAFGAPDPPRRRTRAAVGLHRRRPSRRAVDGTPEPAGQRQHNPAPAQAARNRPHGCARPRTRHRRLELAQGRQLRHLAGTRSACGWAGRLGATAGRRRSAGPLGAGNGALARAAPRGGAFRGAPQARQVADRFHLLQNLRAYVESHMSRVGRHHGRSLAATPHDATDAREVARQVQRDARQAMFERVQRLRAGGQTMRAIAAQTGVGWRTVTKWVRSGCLSDRNRAAPEPRSPRHFQEYLKRRWTEGCTYGRYLFWEIQHRGYEGSYSHLQKLLAEWRRSSKGEDRPKPKQQAPLTTIAEARAVDPATGWQISPITAASLCLTPGGMLTLSQVLRVEALKQVSPSFTIMRRLAMRFRGLLRSGKAAKLDAWLRDARASGIR